MRIELDRRFLVELKPDWLHDVWIDDHSEGTCEWILDLQEFDSWLRPSGMESIFWIRGPPGVGKTVLAKFVYRQLKEVELGNAGQPITKKFQWASAIRKNPPESFQVLACFLDSNNSDRKSELSVVQSLLYQMLSANQKFFRHVHGKQLFRRPQRGDFRQYMELLSAVLKDPSLSETVIVIDSLDKCEETSRSLLVESMKVLLSQSKVKVLVTSRSLPAVKIEPFIKIDMEYQNEHVDRDISRYVVTAVKDLSRERKLPVHLEIEITAKLLKFPSKNYLWVQLALQSVAKSLTLRSLRNKLDRSTPSLFELYSETLNRSNGPTVVALRRTLYFAAIVEEPLQVQELSALLAISQTWDTEDRTSQGSDLNTIRMEIAKSSGMEDILENKTMNFEEDFMPYFRPLVEMNERSISLAHFTLHEFLRQHSTLADFQATFALLSPDHFARSHVMPEVHSIMAILCLQYLFAAFRDGSDPLVFALYAAMHWTRHARKASECHNQVLKALIRSFFENTEFVSKWLQILGNSGDAPNLVLPSASDTRSILAGFDLGRSYADLLGISKYSLVREDVNQRNPLHFAAANNAISSVYWISEIHDFDYMSTQTDTDLQFPIHLAAKYGHKKIVEILLEIMDSDVPFHGDVFEMMASNGHKELFKMLYSRTEVQGPHRVMHLLEQAAKLDSVDMVMELYGHLRSLVDRGQVSSADLSDNTIAVLHAALRMQCTTVIDFLLENGGFHDVVDRRRWTALHVAADEGNVSVASQLIERGVRINTRNFQGDGALHIASRNGFPDLVRLLCEKGAMVDLPNNSGQLPAHLAAETRNKDILRILCDHGTNVLAMDGEGHTTLHAASKAGRATIVSMLVVAGADVDAQDFRGRTPLHYAIESGDLRIFYNLLSAGADRNTFDLGQIYPIHLAAEQGSELLIRELLKVGVDSNCQDSQGRTPLHHSCSSKLSTTIAARVLLESGVKVQVSDSKGAHPLHLAAEQGSVSTVKLLISHGADLNCSDTEGRNPLHYGCSSKRSMTAVMRLLIQKGTDVNWRDNDMNTPLYYAEQNNKGSVVKLLTDAGACL